MARRRRPAPRSAELTAACAALTDRLRSRGDPAEERALVLRLRELGGPDVPGSRRSANARALAAAALVCGQRGRPSHVRRSSGQARTNAGRAQALPLAARLPLWPRRPILLCATAESDGRVRERALRALEGWLTTYVRGIYVPPTPTPEERAVATDALARVGGALPKETRAALEGILDRPATQHPRQRLARERKSPPFGGLRVELSGIEPLTS